MTLEHAIFLFAAGILGGALNSVAGGGSFLTFPALLFVGVPPIPANATNCLALWTGATASGGAYRNRLNVPMRMLLPLLGGGVVGGIVGAFLLLRTPAHTFMRVLPWLMMGATLLFVFGKKLARTRDSSVPHSLTTAAIVAASIFELAIAVYGGYFGGGIGIVNLAMLAAIGMTDIHAMNAIKSVLGVAINGIAAAVFVVKGAIYWPQGVVVIAGALLGGYFGAHYAQKLPQAWVRWFVILVGTAMSTYFFWRAYL
ncbi:MAG: sulfite exporter TauE/SafE family protein [Terriglobales bacterium]